MRCGCTTFTIIDAESHSEPTGISGIAKSGVGYCSVGWRATNDDDEQYCFAVAL
jgi:hypothetical protein